ncbi:MAG: PKD domain-containing protein, partial [Flavobacteriales bacterium]|nr:PKD domain-containing protein [Flavobacteriales bacterium]
MKYILPLSGLLVASQLFSQGVSTPLRNDLPEWARLMYLPDADPGAVEAAFNAYYATHRFVKNTHTQYYKRWKRDIGHAYIPLDPAQRASYPTDLRSYLDATDQLAATRAANWQCIGPIDWDHGAVDRSYAAGAAHVYTVEQAPSDGNIVFAGTATAGLWKSTDKGLNWTNVTKAMMVGEVLSVEIASTDANTVWFGAEGDLFKSTNGGANWAVVGDATFNAQQHEIRDIALLPGNDQVLFVCSDKGLYRSTNGGTSFTQVRPGIWQEIEFKPGTPSTVYAVEQTSNLTRFWRSTDSGLSFTQQTGGWPVPLATDEQERTEITVTPADPNVVYALCTGAADGGSGLYGIYKSTDSGTNWTFQCCGAGPAGVPSPANMNLMGWSDVGTDDGGQYYYDLALAADPANANSIQVGGVNRWVSTDGGATFTCPAKWSHSYKADYVHADIHDIRYYGAEIWVACDGGAFYSSNGGATFERRIHGIAGTDFWGFGVGGWTGSQVMLGGTYHNGTLLKDNNVYQNGWVSTDGGDGIRGFVHPQYDRRALSDYGYKTLSGDRLIPNGNSDWSREPNGSYIVGESSELAWHPNRAHTAFLGSGNGLWRTDDNGTSFSLVHDFGAKVTSIEVAFSDPDHIYVCTYPGWWETKKIWRSTDGGSTWTDITPSSAQLNGNVWVPYDIAVSAVDPLTIWMCRTSMYGNSPNLNGFVVYRSTNGGATWTNISDATLNGEWPTNISHQYGSAGELYIGTRRAVYRRNDATGWALWNAGLPAKVQSTRLLINYREGLIRNGTDRSVWESPLETLAPPVANFAVDNPTPTCNAPQVVFFDNSALNGNGAAWSWTFPGGNPSSGTGRTAVVTYDTPGTYSATLTVTDANGSSTRTITNIVTFAPFTATAPLAANAEDEMVVPQQ